MYMVAWLGRAEIKGRWLFLVLVIVRTGDSCDWKRLGSTFYQT